MGGKHGPPEWRFWRHVDKAGPLPERCPELGPCWLWLGATYAQGYGQWRAMHGGRSGPAHRYAYELVVGPIPDGLELDHLCIVPGCVNPAHLEPVTREENMRRMRRSHCRRGHPFDAANTYLEHRANGQVHRRCRACGLLHQATFRARGGRRTV